ncbi:MAG: hypothetical protein J6Y72_05750 [Bacteroidales bacterium]|nr:hypothetical protein [Bacteroidales bacterium]
MTTKLNLLSAMNCIADCAKNSKLNDKFYSQVSGLITYVSKKLNITDEQCVMLALLVNMYDDERMTINKLGRYVDCNTTQMLTYSKAIFKLEKCGYIKCNHNLRYKTYCVPHEVIDAFLKNEKYERPNISPVSEFSFDAVRA